MKPAPYWHLRGRARQIAKAKWCKYYEDDRATNPALVFDDYCRKYHLTPPDVEVSFVGDKFLLRCGDKQQILPTDAPVNVARLIFQSLSRPLSACGEAESTNQTRQETNDGQSSPDNQ